MRFFLAMFLLAMGTRAGAMDLQLGGHGSYAVDRTVPCLTAEQRADIQTRLARSRADLESRGVLTSRALSGGVEPEHALFGWPLKPLIGNDPSYYGISNFVDENPAFPNQVLDYNCGSRTYDTSAGYNHQGTDFFLWPFPWYKMDNEQVEIVAAAPGVILAKDDGNYDRSCSLSGGEWNAVYIADFDGSEVWYGHMKTGSLTTKAPGDTVRQGDFLGFVGSSGNSTGPHLHFEVYNSSSQLTDPWGGTCNYLGGQSRWADQRPYYDPAIDALDTGSAAPLFPSCPNEEIPHFLDTFTPGQGIYFDAFYRDQLPGEVTNYSVYDAANTPVESWSDSSPDYTDGSYWYWYGPVPDGYALGQWHFDATFLGQTVRHDFWVVADETAVNGSGPPPLDLKRMGAEPASGRVDLEFHMPVSGVARLGMFDVHGRRVAVLVDAWQTAGAHEVAWDPGAAAAPGVYVARLECPSGTICRKLCVVR
jgi:murein DD-endopeptidase MepM/ murein hydrolase activator NlpD